MATKDDKSKKKQSALSPESQQMIRDNDNKKRPDKASRAGEEPTDKILKAFVGLSSKIDGLSEKLEYHKKELGRYNETLTQILKQAATPSKPDQGSGKATNKKEEDPFLQFRTIYRNLDQRSASQPPSIEPTDAGPSLYPGGQKIDKEKPVKESAN